VKRLTRIGPVAVLSGLGALLLARATGQPVPPVATAAIALLACTFALGLAATLVVRIWRGPPLVTFRIEEVAYCDPAQAELIRAAAQVRGTLGGAGHVHRARLAFPAAAWIAAAAFAAELVPPGADAPLWPLVLLVPAACLSAVWRARPFQYREATGGGLVVHPSAAADWLLEGRDAGRGSQPLSRPVAADGSPTHPG
jgi:hypothetical protein